MSALMIAGIEIHQDQDGRFSLNDFHQAAGAEKRHAPNEWARNSQAQELIEMVAKPGIPGLRIVRGGRGAGTFACKELVYAYAAWLSPAFHLHVIRTFDAVSANDEEHTPAVVSSDAAVEFGKLALAHLPNLGDTSKQALLSDLSEIAFGRRMIPLPKVEEHLLLAGEVVELLGVSANRIGRLATKHDLKSSEFGEVRLSKSRHSDRQCETFYYNAAAVERLRELI